MGQFQLDVATNDVAIYVSDDNEDDGAQGPVVQPKLASYEQALASLEDVLCFLESKGNSKTSDELAKVISQVQSDWLERRTSQSKVTDFFSKSSSYKMKPGVRSS